MDDADSHGSDRSTSVASVVSVFYFSPRYTNSRQLACVAYNVRGNDSRLYQQQLFLFSRRTQMIRVTVLYPKSADSRFDMDYYLNKHTPMVIDRLMPLGLLRLEVDEGLGGLGPDQPPAYTVIAYLIFENVEALQKGLAAHGAEIMGDIANYTNVQPQIQINRIAVG
jgi:uncharacterized protein (TIGR02118 family)